VGRGCSAGGSAPYGYKRIAIDPITKEKTRDLPDGVHRRRGEEVVRLEPGEPREVGIVRRIFDLKAKGAGLKTIANTLNRGGIPCPRRGKWRNKDQKWSCGTVRSIIQNPVYYGARAYNRFPKNKLSGLPRGRRNPSNEWLVVENAHSGIVSKGLFERANASRSYRYAGGSAMVVKSPYLLSGLVRCSHCGFNYTGYTRGDKGLRYYADSGFINKGKAVCEWHAIPKDHLEGFIITAIRDKLMDTAVPRKLEKLIDDYLDRKRNSRENAEQATLEKQLHLNQRKLQNLLDAVESGIGLDTVIPRIKEVEAENERLNRELESLSKVNVSRELVTDAASEASKFLRGFDRKLAAAPITEQKMMIRRVVDGITVDRTREVLECRLLRVPKLAIPVLASRLQNRIVQSRVCPEQGTHLIEQMPNPLILVVNTKLSELV
jgi:hypothetical protein